ncbi:MAG: 3-dehydroquinate synthase [Peptococcaceae bacterium]|nr:3-dehydroquinate synthase [Peptococcaceae bacterium]
MNVLKNLEVALGARSYHIEIGTGLLSHCGEKIGALVKGRQAAVITDSNVGSLYAETVQKSLEQQGFQVTVITIPAGEASKSWQQAEQILTVLLEKKFHRDACVVALGGGVTGDLAGFVASVYQRGIAFFQIPTSLLAQVDSSVGGKVAVNHALGKNMIGSFYQPKLVLIDMDTLKTLEQRHWQNGLAEVVKYGVIYDAAFFEYLQQNAEAVLNRELEVSSEVIARCCRLKAEVVALDETEGGVRAKLNYGHTIGHGLELAGHYQGYLHGEAVAVGMVLAARYAAEQGMCDASLEAQITDLLKKFCLPVCADRSLSIDEVMDGMALDKKVQDGQLVFILPETMGDVKIVKGIPQSDIRALLQREYEA